MTKETKSERLFRHAFFEAKRAIESLGAGKIDALSSLHKLGARRSRVQGPTRGAVGQ